MQVDALILRRTYPVPVTFADLRRAYRRCGTRKVIRHHWEDWVDAIALATGAQDEIFAVDGTGREARVAILTGRSISILNGDCWMISQVKDLCERADEAGYWERPREIRLDVREDDQRWATPPTWPSQRISVQEGG